MVDASVVVSVVIAVVSLLGTLAVAAIGFYTSRRLDELKEKRQSDRELDALTAKYSVPLLIAAYELQARLYELLKYPISKQHLESKDGLEDIKIFTCYTFAQFLGWAHLFKIKTQYFMFSKDPHLQNIGQILLRLDEEFDRRRDDHGQNIGVWPGPRLLVSERMLKKPQRAQESSEGNEAALDTMVKDYNDFVDEWDGSFKDPMGYFCQWIDDMVASRTKQKEGWDYAMRCTQHILVDMIHSLNQIEALSNIKGSDKMQASEEKSDGLFRQLRRCEEGAFECDCTACPHPTQILTLEDRSDSRLHDQGLKPWYHNSGDKMGHRSGFATEAMTAITSTHRYKQGPRIQ